MRGPLPAFIDSGAWIALAVEPDPNHEQAKERWLVLNESGARYFTSIPIILETFTFLERNTDRLTALIWKNELDKLPRLVVWECPLIVLKESWKWFDRKDLHKLSAVDATSFTLMIRNKVKRAFTFDAHFSTAGFQIV
ncbi:MAG: PIN domain-containing protein [Planctomycetes bacterium]|nr:PIN domain-containing protein [Planctomycetota bacterium]